MKKKGPAIGFGSTTLALCDVVYCVPEATFSTPFMKLGNYHFTIRPLIILMLIGCLCFNSFLC